VARLLYLRGTSSHNIQLRQRFFTIEVLLTPQALVYNGRSNSLTKTHVHFGQVVGTIHREGPCQVVDRQPNRTHVVRVARAYLLRGSAFQQTFFEMLKRLALIGFRLKIDLNHV